MVIIDKFLINFNKKHITAVIILVAIFFSIYFFAIYLPDVLLERKLKIAQLEEIEIAKQIELERIEQERIEKIKEQERIALEKKREQERIELAKKQELARLEEEKRKEQERIALEKKREQERAEKRRIAKEHKNRVYEYSQKAKNRIIRKYGRGQDKNVNVLKWAYNESDDTYKIKLELQWYGTYFSSNYYAVDGYLTIKKDGGSPKWFATWKNSQLEKYLKNKEILGMVGKGVVILKALNVVKSTSSPEPTKNETSKD
jgi:flagellar biosynthesis GTPase FlhF